MAEKIIQSRINWACIETEEDDEEDWDRSSGFDYIPFYDLKVS